MKKTLSNLLLIIIGTIIIVGLLMSAPLLGNYKYIPLLGIFIFFLFGMGMAVKFEADFINNQPEPYYPLNRLGLILSWYGIIGLILYATNVVTSLDIILGGAIAIFLAFFISYYFKIGRVK
jgi:hypothetical protein